MGKILEKLKNKVYSDISVWEVILVIVTIVFVFLKFFHTFQTAPKNYYDYGAPNDWHKERSIHDSKPDGISYP